MAENKNETSEALDFNEGGNCAAGKTEKHGGPYAVNGIADKKGGDSKDKDSK